MSGDNPFEVSADAYGDRSARDRDVITAEVSSRTIELLNQTRPWVSLMGVLLWIGTVLIAVGSIMALIGGLMAGQGGMIFIAAIYIALGLAYGYLAKSLTGYAARINRLNASESVGDLEDAMECQKNFWRAVGIITLAGILLYIVIIAMVFAGFAFLGNFGRM
ncbi:hypothetical protein GC176_18140 [bacterium]|nr:hypothetical protein [bacterium]